MNSCDNDTSQTISNKVQIPYESECLAQLQTSTRRPTVLSRTISFPRFRRFVRFTAERSGGACLNSGVLVGLGGSKFIGNRAGGDGPAVMSLGIVENITDTSFESNTNYCPPGEYGYDIDEFEDEVTKLQYFPLARQSVDTFHVSV